MAKDGHSALKSTEAGGRTVPTNWSIVGTGDFNGDGKWDILWRDTTSGNIAIWEMNGTTVLNPSTAGIGNVPTPWSIVGTGDFNRGGKRDVGWPHTGAHIAAWFLNAQPILNPHTRDT